MTDIEAEFVEIGELRAFLARPLGGSTGGMLLLPMITGINDQVREYAEDIAGTGVTALVWDPWHGHSADDTPREQLVEWMGELQDDAVLVEMNTLLEHAFGELGLSKVGVIGWCLGGRLALILGGGDPRVANVVAYHPSIFVPAPPHHTVDAVESASRIAAPVMILHAGATRSCPPRRSGDYRPHSRGDPRARASSRSTRVPSTGSAVEIDTRIRSTRMHTRCPGRRYCASSATPCWTPDRENPQKLQEPVA